MKIFIRVLAIIAISITIALAAGFFFLKRGISISELSISNTQISSTHLIWDDKLKLAIEKITIQAKEKKSSANLDATPVRDALHAAKIIEDWFTSIAIDQIIVGSVTAEFKYHEDTGGLLNVNSPQAELQAKILTDAEFLLIDIEKLNSPQYKSHAEGKVRIDTANRQLTATFEGIIADTLPLQLEVKADREQLSFSGHGTQSVASIAPVVEVFDLGPDISPWISEYLTASEISLTTVSGTIPYENPASLLPTLHTVANVKDTEYTFAQGLAPIKAKETDVIFQQGVLKIKPRNASFYGQDTGNSELDINFNNDPFILTAYIRTKAQASSGILTLLEFYGIPFPFEQKEGLTDTDLTLAINLSTIEIDAKGSFKADKSVFEYDQQLFDVNHLDIGLNNTDITLHKLDISKNDKISARISGELDTAKSQGDLQVSLNKFSYHTDHSELLLENPNNAPLNIHYQMRPEGDSVSVAASNWKMADVQISVGEITTAIDHKTWSGKLPPTPVSIDPWLNTRVSGTFNRKPPYADLDITLVGLTHESLRMEQPEIEIELVIGNEISLKTKSPVKLSANSTPFKLTPTHVTYAEQKLSIHQSGLELKNQFSSGITGHFDVINQTGKLALDQVKLADKTGLKILVVEDPAPIELLRKEKSTQLKVPMLGIEFNRQDQGGWSIALQDFSKLYPNSPLMQNYNLKEGELLLTSQDGSVPYSISGRLTSPDAFLIEGDNPVHDYHYSGQYDGTTTTLAINDKVHIKVAEKVTINSNNVGYNLPVILNIGQGAGGKQNQQDAATESKNLSLKLDAKDSFIYLSDDRRALADEFTVTIDKGKIEGDLKFGKGFASLQIKDDKLSLVGKGFKGPFLNELLSVADFDKGQMEFQVSGSFDEMDAVFRIEDAVINNYGLLNNILAFINTVPALLTFSKPSYHRHGLPADEINIALNVSNRVIKIKSLNVDSKELDMRGEGEVNLNDNSIDLVVNLITGAKKSVGRIPLLGYVLSGKEKQPSVTLTVKGDLNDPKVKNTAFKEVVTYPYQVLKRTIVLPGHLVKKVTKETGDRKIDSSDDLEED
jgi:hypothetical protein